MPLVIVLASVAVLFLLQQLIYKKYWNKGLDANVYLGEDRYIFEGDTVEVEEELSNDKRLPLPWVYLKFQFSCNGQAKIYRSDMFSIGRSERIRRKRRFALKDRGVYEVAEIDTVSHDLFITKTFSDVLRHKTEGVVTVYPALIPPKDWPVPFEQLNGDIITKRTYLEDPYLFKGIREYQQGDSFRSLNFKASAKAGQWMVNRYETTASQKVALLLGMDKSTRYYDPAVYEQAMRIAGTLCSSLEREGIPVSLYSNGVDTVENIVTSVPAGCGEEHIYAVLEALARISIDKTQGAIADEITRCADEQDKDTVYVLISPGYRTGIKEAYEGLSASGASAYWIMPVPASDVKDKDYPPNLFKDELENFSYWEI